MRTTSVVYRAPGPVDRSGCAAPSHGTEAAYGKRCRCPDAREDKRLKEKRRRHGRHDPVMIDATGSTRRLQALARARWDCVTLSSLSGVPVSTLNHIRVGAFTTVDPQNAAVIAKLYESLQGTPGTSLRAQRAAVRNGWWSIWDWHDLDIDDPVVVPPVDDAGVDRIGLPRRCSRGTDLDELAHLLAGGITDTEICRKLDITPRALRDLLGRLGVNRRVAV